MRCSECGSINPDNKSQCSICGYEFLPYAREASWSPLAPYEEPVTQVQLFSRPERYPLQEAGSLSHRGSQIQGTVIAIDGPYLEPPDFDLPGVLLKLLLVTILAPFIIGLFILYILISIPLSIIGLGGVMKSFNPINILIAIGLFRGLFGIPREREDLPVRFFYLQDEIGNEYVLRMKGHLRSGSLALGHQITAWGKWRDNVLHTTRALNLRTGSSVIVEDTKWKWRVLMVVLVVTIILVLGLLSSI